VLPRPPTSELPTRLPRLFGGLVLFGVGIALMVRADLGLAPWDVFHQGVAELTGLPIGRVTILTGAVVLLLWIPLHERPGIGTIANVLVIGVVEDAALAVIDPVHTMGPRIALLLLGVYVFGPGSGLYIGAGLGPGPRDGLMTGLSKRGISVRVARTIVEAAVLVVGFALGGTVGIGTILFLATVGPNVHWHLDRLSLPGVLPSAAIEGT
jgi:uncharacterized membrane protein YczE